MDADVRDTDEARRNGVLAAIREACARVAAERKVEIKVVGINADAPATCSPKIIQAIEETAAENRLAYRKMVSRAYHDSLIHVADRAGRDGVHPLPGGSEPSAG